MGPSSDDRRSSRDWRRCVHRRKTGSKSADWRTASLAIAPGDDLKAYAEALERHYGAEPGTLFAVAEGRFVMLRPNVSLDAARYFMALTYTAQPEDGAPLFIVVGEGGP